MSDSYQIEMTWRCSTCAHENLGRHKKCQGCGKPLEDEEFIMPGDTSPAAAVTDPEQLRHATAGEDWECIFCKTHQRRSDGACANCGASATEQKAGVHVRKIEPAREIFSPERRATLLIFGGGTFAGLLLLLFIWWLVPKEVDAVVLATKWRHAVHVERYQIWPREGFDPAAGAFNVKDEGQRIHHYDDVLDHYRTEHYSVSVACGQSCRTVSTPRTCSSNRNGYATCSGGGSYQSCSTKYCDSPRTRQVPVYRQEPRYRMYHSWNIWDWGENRVVVEGGQNDKPFWPKPEKVALEKNIGKGEHERERRETTYGITFGESKGKDDDKYEFVPRDEREFVLLPKGTHRRIRVGPLGGVELL